MIMMVTDGLFKHSVFQRQALKPTYRPANCNDIGRWYNADKLLVRLAAHRAHGQLV
jgi:hypothetical protein